MSKQKFIRRRRIVSVGYVESEMKNESHNNLIQTTGANRVQELASMCGSRKTEKRKL